MVRQVCMLLNVKPTEFCGGDTMEHAGLAQ